MMGRPWNPGVATAPIRQLSTKKNQRKECIYAYMRSDSNNTNNNQPQKTSSANAGAS